MMAAAQLPGQRRSAPPPLLPKAESPATRRARPAPTGSGAAVSVARTPCRKINSRPGLGVPGKLIGGLAKNLARGGAETRSWRVFSANSAAPRAIDPTLADQGRLISSAEARRSQEGVVRHER